VKTKEAPNVIESMQVEYKDYIKKEVATGRELNAGEESKKFELRNSDEDIRNVIIENILSWK
jgi:hypothetical protein